MLIKGFTGISLFLLLYFALNHKKHSLSPKTCTSRSQVDQTRNGYSSNRITDTLQLRLKAILLYSKCNSFQVISDLLNSDNLKVAITQLCHELQV